MTIIPREKGPAPKEKKTPREKGPAPKSSGITHDLGPGVVDTPTRPPVTPTGTPGGPPIAPEPERPPVTPTGTPGGPPAFTPKVKEKLPVMKPTIPASPRKTEDSYWYRVPGSAYFYQGIGLKNLEYDAPDLYKKLRSGIEPFKVAVREGYMELPQQGGLRAWVRKSDMAKLAKNNPEFYDRLVKDGVRFYGSERLRRRMANESLADLPRFHYFTSVDLPYTYDTKTGEMVSQPLTLGPVKAKLLGGESRKVSFMTSGGSVSFKTRKPPVLRR